MNHNLSTHTDAHPPEKAPAWHGGHGGHGGHGWMMMACCVPMLVIAVVLVATGVISSRFLVTAVACTVMMAVMMRMMPGHDNGDHSKHG
jgi:nitrate/nitrite transporter NarK